MKTETKKIKELFEIEKGTLQSSKNMEGEYLFVTASSEYKSHNKYTYDCPAIVIAVAASGSLGRVHYVSGKFIASDLCFVLTPKKEYADKINLQFYYFLLSSIQKELVQKLAKGAAKKAINKGDFGNFEIPFLQIENQNLAVSKILKAKDVVKQLLTTTHDVHKSVSALRQLITDSLGKAKKDFTEVNISDFLSRNRDAIKVDDGTTYKRVTIRMHSKGVTERDEVVGSKIGTKRQSVIKSGQLLISKIDARQGAFGIAPVECNGAITTADFLSYNINQKLIDPILLNELLQTKYFKELFIKSSQGATNRKRFSEGMFLKQKVFLPKINEQKSLVSKLKLIYALGDVVGSIEKNTEQFGTKNLPSLLQGKELASQNNT